MKVYLSRRAGIIAPFGVGVDDCGLGTNTFGQYRADTLRALRLPAAIEASDDVVVKGPALVMSDDVLVTKRALRGFLDAGRVAQEPVRLCLPASRLLELFLPLQDVPIAEDGRVGFEVAYVPSGTQITVREALSLRPLRWRAPSYREFVVDVRQPHHILGTGSEVLRFPLTATFAMRVRHWLHVLRASHLMPQTLLFERAMGQPVRSALRVLTSLRFSKPALERALKARFTYRARTAFVHPTATVEASILEPGVRVGAHAYIVNSVIGRDSVIEERAHVAQSTLGPRTFVSRNSTISACSVFGDTDACINGVQACVIAQRCGLTSFAHPLDISPTGNVLVEDEGRLRDAGDMPCGIAFGPECFVGAGVYIAAGRSVPMGTRIVRHPDETVRRLPFDVEPGTLFIVERGGLRPVM